MQATPPLGMYKRVSASVLKERKVLKILEPKGWKNVKGGVNPPESLKGVYEGRLIGMGKSVFFFYLSTRPREGHLVLELDFLPFHSRRVSALPSSQDRRALLAECGAR